ncbi:hypothetical protein D082_09640 [Synechocystis sp. PCC 6714]|nr:hypothetical protein D082_09640 [Synechocystis sp. PCC 6714]
MGQNGGWADKVHQGWSETCQLIINAKVNYFLNPKLTILPWEQRKLMSRV